MLVQLACEVRLLRAVDRAVFTPRPRVDSALIGLRRIGPAAAPEVAGLVREAFAHRRKSLARSLEHARPGTRERARAALEALGLPADARAEQLAPPQFVALAEALAVIVRAPAKLNLCLYVGGRREDGLHELRSLFCPLLLSDRIEVAELEEGEADEVVCPAVDGPNLVAVALEAMRARGWSGPPLRVEIEKRIPVAAGLGGGSADAAAVLRLAAGELGDLDGIAAGLGADVPSQLDPAFALVGGAGEVVEPLPAPGEFAVVLIPDDPGLSVGGRVRARPTRWGSGDRRRSSTSWPPACAQRRATERRRSTTPSCWSTTSSRRRCRCGRRSPRRSRRSTRSARSGRWSPARGRPRSACSTIWPPPTPPPRRCRPATRTRSSRRRSGSDNEMGDPTTPRTRMTHGCRRWIGVIGLARSHGYGLRPASPAQLGPVRPRARAVMGSTISG